MSVALRMPAEGASRKTASTVDKKSDAGPGAYIARKRKITISLSEKSLEALDELRRATDADTDSEVFRNALRLHLVLLRAHAKGVELFMRRADNKEEIVPVTLFVDPHEENNEE